MSDGEQTRKFVKDVFMQTLGAAPTQAEEDFYVRHIEKGDIRADELERYLSGMKPHSTSKKPGEALERRDHEIVPVHIPVEIKADITEELLATILIQSDTFARTQKPMFDFVRYVKKNISDDFWEVFASENERDGGMDFGRAIKLLEAYSVAKGL